MHASLRRGAGRLALSVAAIAAVPAPERAAATGPAVFAGACQLTLRVAYTPPLTVVPAPTVARVDTTASTCSVNGSVAAGALTADLGPVAGVGPMSCEGGALAGRGWFDTTAPGFTGTSMNMEAAQAGDAVAVEFNTGVYVLRGVGPFVADPVAVAGCLAGTPLASTTWTGAVAFEDPTLPTP